MKVSRANLVEVKTGMAANDQRAELVVGCETWGIVYEPGHQRGQMTRWPNGRGAVCLGGDSAWGEWEGGILTLDGVDEEGNTTSYGEDGQVVLPPHYQTCLRCGHQWFPRVPHPVRCPKCFNTQWDRPRKERGG